MASGTVSSTTTAVAGSSLFGMELRLDRVEVFHTAKGPYIGWPREDAEAILEVFEKRIPLMIELVRDHERLATIRARQVQIATQIADTQTEVAHLWRKIATTHTEEQHWWNRSSLWFGIGLAAGVGVVLGIVEVAK